MKIKIIALKNWKNFSDVKARLSDRVFLIGPNAAGKSNFLDALRFLHDVAQDGLEKAVANRGGMKSIRCLSARKNPKINLTLFVDKWEYSLEIDQKSKHLPVMICSEKVRYQAKTILNRPNSADRNDKERLTQTALEQVSANKDFRELADFLKSIVYRHILPQAVRDPLGFSAIPINNDPFGRDIVRQIWNTPSRTRDPRLKRINEALQIAVPNLSELTVNMDQSSGVPHLKVKYKHWRLHGAIQNEMSFSDGTLRLLAMLWTMLEKGGPLLLEEPELSLHEEVVAQLPSIFARLVRGKTGRQVFISTHSRAMLSDGGIHSSEVLLLTPTENGTSIETPKGADKELMEEGLSAADVMLPKAAPKNTKQLQQFSFL